MVTEAVEAPLSLDAKMADYVQKRGGKQVIRRILIANNGMASTKTIMSPPEGYPHAGLASLR